MKDVEIICLFKFARGGSKQLHSYFDSHKELISFPRTFNFYHFLKYINFDTSKISVAKKFIEFQPRFFDFKKWNKYNKLEKYDQNFKINKLLFINNYKERYFKNKNKFNNENLRIFISLHEAYQLSLKRKLKYKTKILYHLHDIYNNDESINQLLRDFGNNIKFLFMTRFPSNTIEAIGRWMELTSLINPDETYYYQYNIFMDTEIMKKYKNIKYLAIPIEKLFLNKEKTLKSIVKWLNISWDKSLMNPTFNGINWKGNSSQNNLDFSYYKNISSYKHINILNKNYTDIINYFFKERMIKYKYFNNNINLMNKFIIFIKIIIPTNLEVGCIKNFLKINKITSSYQIYHTRKRYNSKILLYFYFIYRTIIIYYLRVKYSLKFF